MRVIKKMSQKVEKVHNSLEHKPKTLIKLPKNHFKTNLFRLIRYLKNKRYRFWGFAFINKQLSFSDQISKMKFNFPC